MKKEMVTVNIALHPTAAMIIRLCKKGEIDFENDSLREIGKKCGVKVNSAQEVKHHLEQLVKIGALQKLYGEYKFL